MNGYKLIVKIVGVIIITGLELFAQPFQDRENEPDFSGAPPSPMGEQPMEFFGPPGGPMMFNQKTELITKFDKDGDKRLNDDERKAAREYITKQRVSQFRRRGFRSPFRENAAKPQPGIKIITNDVKIYPDLPLYSSNIVRTIFIEFKSDDWEKELEDFHNTDVEVPAKLIVDGKIYENVGIHFRGSSSYMMVQQGYKRSLNISLDFIKKNQNLYGYRTLNLNNSHEDPSFIRSVLFFDIARNYIPAPKANFVRVVINNEDWGIYVNQQQINKDFIKEWFGTSKGARWKVPGRPNGRAGLEYLGNDIEKYKQLYEIKSKDDTNSWAALINLCKVLNTTPTNELVNALSPILDIDGVLKFLALEIAFINNDGYWIRASDYYIYLDSKGKFHIIPYDENETFSLPEGPGFSSGRTVGISLSPLTGLQDSTKPLRSKLLSLPKLRQRHLIYIKEIAEKWLSLETIVPIAKYYQSLIDEYVKVDNKKLCSYQEFKNAVDGTLMSSGFRRPSMPVTIKDFVLQRQKYLLNCEDIKNLNSPN